MSHPPAGLFDFRHVFFFLSSTNKWFQSKYYDTPLYIITIIRSTSVMRSNSKRYPI